MEGTSNELTSAKSSQLSSSSSSGEGLASTPHSSSPSGHETKDAALFADCQNNTPPLLDSTSCDEHPPTHVAVGAIRIRETLVSDPVELDACLCIGGPHAGTIFPEIKANFLIDHGYIQIEVVRHRYLAHHHSVRITVRPEDVERDHCQPWTMQSRRYFKHVMAYVDKSGLAWIANWDLSSPFESYLHCPEQESLFFLFNTLSPPDPKIESITDLDTRQAIQDIFEQSVVGLRTPLYPYQRRSAAMMIQREVHPKKSSDPRKRCFHGPTGQRFYYDKEEGTLVLQPLLFEDPNGGILAETMGYGKTLICLTVILATKGHHSAIPVGKEELENELPHRTASLAEMAASKIIHDAIPWKASIYHLATKGYHYDSCVKMLQSRCKRYTERLLADRVPNRGGRRRAEQVVRLSSTTLVVIPPNLLLQWQQEIKKHAEHGSLDVLVLDSSSKTVPHCDRLALYDVVLITKGRLNQEYRDNDLNTGRQPRDADTYQSSLTELRWLRIILDEGVGFSGTASRTNIMAMLDKMYFDRRWVVSGTPSNSLHGVEVGLAANERVADKARGQIDVQTSLEMRRKSNVMDRENRDLDQLRVLAIKFLKVKPWANLPNSDRANWSRYLLPFDIRGERRDVIGLRALLESIMVRHTIADVEADLSLPPLHNTVVYLEPSFHDMLSINLFIMLIVSNAVTSEREDKDYMFHPSNRKPLDEIVGNMRHSSFHWTGITKSYVEQCIRNSEGYLKEKAATISTADRDLLTTAIEVGERAINHRGWLFFSALHETGVFVEDFPDHAAENWALGPAASPLLLGAAQAREAQKHVAEHAHDEDPGEGLPGAGIRVMVAARKQAARDSALGVDKTQWMQELQNSRKNNKRKRPSSQSDSEGQNGEEQQQQKGRGGVEGEEAAAAKRSLPLNSPLTKTKIIGFSSTKLNYLVDQILEHGSTSKAIIFYDHDNIAFWIASALDLFPQLRFRIYARSLTPCQRSTYLSLFLTDPSVRILLMDLHHASHGLHVVVDTPTRIYIVTPIWQPQVEAQAIKRAHRIGQTHPVHVETLVLRGTLEDVMLRRRKEMTHAESTVARRSLLDDRGGMRDILENGLRFLRFEEGGEGEGEGEAQRQVARLCEPKRLFA